MLIVESEFLTLIRLIWCQTVAEKQPSSTAHPGLGRRSSSPDFPLPSSFLPLNEMKKLLKGCTFPSERREEVRGRGPLNTSQIRQPSRHTSPALTQNNRSTSVHRFSQKNRTLHQFLMAPHTTSLRCCWTSLVGHIFPCLGKQILVLVEKSHWGHPAQGPHDPERQASTPQPGPQKWPICPCYYEAGGSHSPENSVLSVKKRGGGITAKLQLS